MVLIISLSIRLCVPVSGSLSFGFYIHTLLITPLQNTDTVTHPWMTSESLPSFRTALLRTALV